MAALSPLPPSLDDRSQGSDLFEAYLFTVVVQAALDENAHIRYETSSGGIPPSLRSEPVQDTFIGAIVPSLMQLSNLLVNLP